MKFNATTTGIVCLTIMTISAFVFLAFILFLWRDCVNGSQKDKQLLIEKCCPDSECCKDLIYKHLYPLKAQYPVEKPE